MNKKVTSQEEILKICRDLIAHGKVLNIRQVAQQADVAVGSIYHYFPSKNELLNATIESVWQEVFDDYGKKRTFRSLSECVTWIFECLQQADQQYPGFLSVHGRLLATSNGSRGDSADREASEATQEELQKLSEERMRKSLYWLEETIIHAANADPDFRPDSEEDWFNRELGKTLLSLILSSFVFQTVDENAIQNLVRHLARS